jgi:hypothetical protein
VKVTGYGCWLRRGTRAFVKRLVFASIVLVIAEAAARAETPPPPLQDYPAPPAYPPPAYSPQPYPPAYPPPAYPYQGYPPPGSYGYAAPPLHPRVPRRRTFELIPYLGLQSYRGEGGAHLGPGTRLGGLIGLRVGDNVWINGELTIDSLSTRNLPDGDSYDEYDFAASLSPLVFVPAGDVQLAFGPKLGAWAASYNQSSFARGDGNGSYSGFDLGVNGAAFFQVGRKLWLGGLASFDLRTYRSSCFTAFAGIEGCSSTLPAADKVVAISALLMFST